MMTMKTDKGEIMMVKIDFNSGWKYAHYGKDDYREITLPHDAMFCEERSEDNPSGKNGAYFAGFDYIYVKTFVPDSEWKGFFVYLELESVYHDAEVYLNGEKIAYRPYGYLPITADLTEKLMYGKNNEIKVIARNAEQPSSRWYTGAGIYRPAYLYVLPEKHILPNGVRIKTTDYNARAFELTVRTNADGNVSAEIADGNKVLWKGSAGTVNGETVITGAVPEAKLWSADEPSLYTLRVKFGDDSREIRFGFRQLEWSAEKGFEVNGRREVLRGACIHHDNGPIGAIAHPFAEERKVRLMKAAGYNALRMAHNPCSKAMLDACDKLGMYVLDEYVDMWYIHKDKYDYALHHADWWERDLRDIVEKDYNHPSVVMYSTGNEVAETSEERGIKLTDDMTKYLHSMDDTRPVTCGVNIFFNFLYSLGMGQYSDKKAEKNAKRQAEESGKKKKKKAVGSEFFNNLAGLLGASFMKFGATLRGSDRKTRDAYAKMDIAGYNYGINRYKKDVKKYPDRIILGSETFCADAYKFWEFAKTHPALIGDFVWAGMDYFGEVGVGSWVYEDHTSDFSFGVGWLTAGSGRVDVTGGELGEAGYTRVAFELDKIRLAVVPVHHSGKKHSPSAWKHTNAMENWSYDGCEGMRTKAEIYARAYKVELLLNGRKVGSKKLKNDCRAVIPVRYESGTLTAVSYDKNGNELARTSLTTAGKETMLTALPEDSHISAEGLAYIRLKYTDSHGIVKPMTRGRISVKADGGELIGLGHACPFNPDGFCGSDTDTYLGEAVAVVKPTGKGRIKLTAVSEYGEAEAKVDVE